MIIPPRGTRLLRDATALLACVLIMAVVTTGNAAATDARSCNVTGGFANQDLLAAMRRGVNLPGWDNADESRRPTVAQLSALHGEGFNHIRLPLDEGRLSGTDRDAYLDLMFRKVILLLSLDYVVSLDLHAGNAIGQMIERDAKQAEDYLVRLWRAIASRVRSIDPDKLAIELLNEPETGSAAWWDVAARTIAVIRRILPDHTIIVGPAGPQRHETLAGLEPLDDPNVIYAIHYYDPFAFTHQGADWGGEDDPIRYLEGLPFPAALTDTTIQKNILALKEAGHSRSAKVLSDSLDSPWDEAAIAAAFDTMHGWSVKFDRPVIVNEFGVLSDVAPHQSRLNWLAAVSRQAEEHCIGWTHWDFQDGFGLIDPETGMPDAGIMQALVPDAN